MSIQFTVLSSGSRGNSSLVRIGHSGLLLDFGLSRKALVSSLEGIQSSPNMISAALLTHTHGDHAHPSMLLLFASYKIPLYCHAGHRDQLERKPGFRILEDSGLIRYYDDRPFLTPAGLQIEPIRLSHDGGPTYGFRIEGRATRRTRPVSVGYMTDTGCWTQAHADAMANADVLGVEFNHDIDLQKNSGRAPYLIQRNLGPRGHLSNDQGAELVSAVLERSNPGAIRHLVLLHLSDQCNHPKLAIQRARMAVKAAGRRIAIHASRQGQTFPDLLVTPARKRPAVVKAELELFPWEID